MTKLNVSLSAKLQATLKHEGVYAYAVYFDSAGKSQWTPLVDGSKTDVVVNANSTIELPDPFVSGKVYFLIQSVIAGTPANLPTLIKQESDINLTDPHTGAEKLQYRYDSFEVTLSGTAADDGNLTDVIGFGIPMSISVHYPNGAAPQTRGYNENGTAIFDAIKQVDSGLLYPFTEGPLATAKLTRMALSPVSAETSGLPGPTSADWLPYVNSLGTIAPNLKVAGYFNGAPSVEWLLHNGTPFQYSEHHNPGFYSYDVAFTPDKKDPLTGTFTLTPTANSQIKGTIEIAASELANSIYATLGGAKVLGPDGEYLFSSLDNGHVEIDGVMNVGANNQWGAAFVKLLTGFIGGYLGGTATPVNALLGTGSTVDLSKNWNFDPTFAFHGTATAGHPGYVKPWTIESKYGTGVPYDRYAEVFFDHSNSYGNGYSDALTSQFSEGGPLIPVGYIVNPGPPLQQADVAIIDLELFDDDEPDAATTQGYAPTAIYNTHAGPYAAPPLVSATASNLELLLPFGLGQMRLDPDATVTIGFHAGTRDNVATFTGVPIPSAEEKESLFQTWSFTPTGGSKNGPTFEHDGAPSPTGSLIQLNGLPYNEGVNWYQITVANGTASRTYNFYFTAEMDSSTQQLAILNPYYDAGGVNQAGSMAVDNLAFLPQQTNDRYLINTAVVLAPFNGGTLSLDPALLELITDPMIMGAHSNDATWPTPKAPVLGTFEQTVDPITHKTETTFANWGGSTTLDTPNADLARVTSAKLAFAWWGADMDWVGYNVSQVDAAHKDGHQVLADYTNKIGGLNSAHITFDAGRGLHTHTPVLPATADIDGKWMTEYASFRDGNYRAYMTEFSDKTQVALQSDPLDFTVSAKKLSFDASGRSYLQLEDNGGSDGNWITLQTTSSSLYNGTLLAFATDLDGNLVGRDGQTGADVTLADAVLARIGMVKSDGGALLFDGTQSVFLPVGQQMHFAIQTAGDVIETLPGVQVSGTETLSVQVSGSYGTLSLSAFVDNAWSAAGILSDSQRQYDQPLTWLEQGATVQVDVAGSAANSNAIHFVHIDVDQATGAWSVGGVAYGNTDAFRSAVAANWDPAIALSGGRGTFQASGDWTVSGTDGLYAPVLVTEGGDIFVIGQANVDGLDHIRMYGQNTFGFEDLRADQGSDFDYNDMVMQLTMK